MPKAALPPYLEILNPEQQRAVLHTNNPLLILAGAGSGKTRVITTKIAWLIREQGIDPRSILAVTFTNKAAREMSERARLIDERAEAAMLRTFHSFGAWFLRRFGSLADLDRGFVIYDDDDAVSLLATIMEGMPRAEVKAMARSISRAKDYFLGPDDPQLELINSRNLFQRVYREYEEKLERIGNVDFGDLIKKPVEILRQNPKEAEHIKSFFKVILVDEYQDANVAQFELLKELCSKDTYVCVVGDDDQSIYRFRGAEVRNILEFPDRFAKTDIIRLEQNYRSTSYILKAASSVVDQNKNRLGKTLFSERGQGEKPVLAFLPSQDEEAKYCADLILKSIKKRATVELMTASTMLEKQIKEAAQYSDWAILYRTNAQSLEFETEFLRQKIPYKVVGTLKFYEREEIKDALALLSFLVNPKDEVAFRRMINKPSRGLGSVTVERIVEAADNTGGNLIEAIHWIEDKLSAKAGLGAAQFLKAIEAGRATLDKAPHEKKSTAKKESKKDRLRSGEGLSPCVVLLANESGLSEHHYSHDEVAGNQRLNNLQELANAASIYPATMDGLLEFLEHIELDRAMEENPEKTDNAVTLITLHNTKGLEFKKVIMTGVEQGVFPREDKSSDDLEEERRLFYVGATRAMDELYICSCRMRRMYGSTMPMQPSVFLREIDRSVLKITGSIPFGFMTTGGMVNKADANAKDEYWKKGDGVFHDNYGYGEVREIRKRDEGPEVRACFENGAEVRFMALNQGHNFTRIRDAWE